MALTALDKEKLNQILSGIDVHKGYGGIPDADYSAWQREVQRTETTLTFPSLMPVRVIISRAKNQIPECPVHINYHGGGFIRRQDKDDDLYCAHIAAEIHGIVVDVDYAVSTDASFPMAFNQSYEVTRWVFENAQSWGGDLRKISIGGSSAGGCLAAAISLKAGWTGDFSLALQVLAYAATDNYTVTTTGTEEDEQSRAFSMYYADGDPAVLKDPICSPAWATLGEIQHQPRTLMIAPTRCPFYQANLQYAEKLIASGSEVSIRAFPGSRHGFTVRMFDEWRTSQDVIIRYIRNAVL